MQEIKTSLDSEGKVLSVSIDTRPPQIINNSDIKNYMQLQAKLDKAVEALRFYAKKTNYIQLPLRPDGNSSTDIIGSPIDKDDGKIAKQTLAEIGG